MCRSGHSGCGHRRLSVVANSDKPVCLAYCVVDIVRDVDERKPRVEGLPARRLLTALAEPPYRAAGSQVVEPAAPEAAALDGAEDRTVHRRDRCEIAHGFGRAPQVSWTRPASSWTRCGALCRPSWSTPCDRGVIFDRARLRRCAASADRRRSSRRKDQRRLRASVVTANAMQRRDGSTARRRTAPSR